MRCYFVYMLSSVFVSVFSFSVYSQAWLQVESNVECPDLLKLQGERYSIYNDCYGTDPRHPIIETGNIILNENHITFHTRSINQDSFLQRGTNSIKLIVLLKTDAKLHLRYGKSIFKFKKVDKKKSL
ncbi:hypothetical protein [Pseudoalteromonas luteoviolacea]|uniref:hypothetical protein n=1 Tax=Pseudoalteromonas luteoviolacea TaxID=43657 RepID=UPI001B39A51B|nr:hypothetical protein [Pseudoalteromonas luteoviolacea]MBQ4836585.1 hypothetical protein [Pseudoalteromonas luteoviolacea]